MKKRLLALALALVMVFSLLPAAAFADTYSGSCGDNVSWSLDTSTGVLTISGSGEMTNYSVAATYLRKGPGGIYKSDIKTVIIQNGVTSIGNRAFYSYSNLTSITIPSSVTSIGDRAFFGCSSLTSVTIPNSVTSIGTRAFSNCSSLTNIKVSSDNTAFSSYGGVLFDKNKTELICCPGGKSGNYSIPSSVTSIDEYAFYGCSSLTSVTIPNSVTSIGEHAFYICRSLTNINVANDNTAYSSSDGVLFNKNKTELICCPGGKSGSYTIPSSVTSIGSYAFYYCSKLTSIAMSNSVTSIGSYAFEYCTGLIRIAMPNSLKSISDYTFSDCSSLTSVKIPSSVTSIGSGAFSGCSSLTDVYYTGSSTEWSSITIDDSSDALTNATIHYNYVCDHNYRVLNRTAATCTTKGYTTYQCSICGESYNSNYTSATGHNYSYSVTKQPTVSSQGKIVGTCNNCGGKTGEIAVPELNKTDYTYKVTKEATCSNTGIATYTWNKTTYGTFSFDAIISKLSHSYEYSITKQPTESSSGKLVGVCKDCADTTDEIVLPELNKTDYTYKVTKAATYYETGTGTYTWNKTTYGTFSFDVSLPMLTLDAPVITATRTANSVKLTWNAVEGATGYIVQRRAATGTKWSDLATTDGLTYTNSNITAGNAYSYRVVAYAGDVDTNSSVSKYKTAYVGQVTGLSLAQQKKGIKVSWSKLKNASGYKVYRKVSSGDWKLIKTITSGSTLSYTDTAATNTKRNYYKIIAYRTISDVKYTAVESASKNLIYVAAPSLSSATNSGSGKITVKWTKNSSATGYRVKVMGTKLCSFYTITSPSTLSKVITGKSKDTYKIYVQAYKIVNDKKYYSEWSSYKTVKVTK